MEKTQAEIDAANAEVTRSRLKASMLNALIDGRGYDAHVLYLRLKGYPENDARYLAWHDGPSGFKAELAAYIC